MPRSGAPSRAALLLHDKRHLHIAMARAAVVVADGVELPGLGRRERRHGGCAGDGVEVEVEGGDEQAVGAVEGRNAQCDGLAFLQRNHIRCVLELLCRDLDHARRLALRDGEKGQQGDQDDELFLHRDVSPLMNCWMPSLPAISFVVSSTSLIDTSRPREASWRMPRLRKGSEASKGMGFLSWTAAGSGKAKMSERAA